MGWPTPQDYNEAIQNPLHCFSDPELRSGVVEVDYLGLPRATTGAFACVYKVSSADRVWAVRCLLNNIADQHDRYEALSRFITSDSLDFTVPFYFLRQGIRVHGKWYPIVKMEWVEGITLDAFVGANLQNVERLDWLSQEFLRVVQLLSEHGVAHGDLQHGNIIVSQQGLRLVDYDGMYVPELAGMDSNEVGHRNYQHPSRDSEHFGPELDNFSAWVIYCSLKILQAEPLAMGRLLEDREGLIFSREDFCDERNSLNFRFLEQHEHEEVATHARLLRLMLRYPLMQCPPLTGTNGHDFSSLPELAPLSREEFAAMRASMLVSKDAAVVPERRFEMVSLRTSHWGVAAPAPDWANSEAEPVLPPPSLPALGPYPLVSRPELKYEYQYLNDQWLRAKKLASPLRATLAWQEIGAFFAIMMFWTVTHGVGSTSTIPVIGFLGIIGAWIYRWAYQQKLFKERTRAIKEGHHVISAGTSVIVQFHVVTFHADRAIDEYFPPPDKQRRAGLPSVQLKEERCPVELVATYMPIKNWEQLDEEQKRSLSWDRDFPTSGFLYYRREDWKPVVLVTDRNVPLWFI